MSEEAAKQGSAPEKQGDTWQDNLRFRNCGTYRHCHSLVFLPAVQYSFQLHEADPADWRFSVRQQVQLWLFQAQFPVQPAIFSGRTSERGPERVMCGLQITV